MAWCTGFRDDFSWIDLPVFGEDGQPVHWRGVVADEPGLYFVGLEFTYAFSSPVINGLGRDAGYIARHIASRGRNGRPATPRPAGTRRTEAAERVRSGAAGS